jgi:hypothetical protein
MIYLLCILLITLSWSQHAVGLDVNWLPADADGPLPLSLAYRENLRKLCVATEEGSSVPNTIQQADQKKIIKLCAKLREYPSGLDEDRFSNGNGTTFFGFDYSKLKGLVIATAVAVLIYTFFQRSKRVGQSGSVLGSTRSAPPISADELRQSRAARYST